MTTAASREEALRLRTEGLSYRQVAARVGVAQTTVRRWLNPEYAERDRKTARLAKEKHREPCPFCGRPMTATTATHDGKPPRSCRACTNLAYRRWTPERIIEAIQEWNRVTGSSPAAAEWTAARALMLGTPERAAMWVAAAGRYPSVDTVQRVFGSWSAGLRAAGVPANRSGRRPRMEEAA